MRFPAATTISVRGLIIGSVKFASDYKPFVRGTQGGRKRDFSQRIPPRKHVPQNFPASVCATAASFRSFHFLQRR